MTSLRAAARGGIRWTSLAAVVTGVTQVVQALVLVRLLDADEFGAMAASMVVVGFAQRFADMGISNAVVVRDLDRGTLSTLFWANLAFGVVLGGAIAATAPAVAAFYDDSDVTAVVLVLALLIPAAALGSVAYGLAQKQLRFERIAKTDIASAVAGFLVVVGTAAAGLGAVSMALGLVVASLLRSGVFLATAGWSPQLRLRWNELRQHLAFGGYQMGERAAGFLYGNVDYLLIGRFLGTEALGYYSIAFQLIIRPLAQLNPLIMRVAMPLFAKRQTQNEVLRRGFLEVSRLIAFVSFPALVGLAVVAPVFVPVVLGEHWMPSVSLLQILAFVGALKTLGTPVGSVVLAKDRPDLSFKLMILIASLTTVGLYAVVREGTEAVAWTSLGLNLAALILIQPWALSRLVDLRPREYARAFTGPVVLTSLLAAATLIAYEVAQHASASDGVVLISASLAGALTYLVAFTRLERDQWVELKRLIKPRTP